jgi:ferredoxin
MRHFRDHGTVRLTIGENLDEAQSVLDGIKAAGIDLAAVCRSFKMRRSRLLPA